jgi:hypothetical protein
VTPLPQADARPIDVLGLFQSFLAALCNPDGGRVLHGLLAGVAIVRDGERLVPAAQVDVEAFAGRHRDISLRHRALPVYSEPTLLEASAPPDQAETVAWFEVTEAQENHRLIVVLGMVSGADGARIGWCTLASQVGSWSYRDGLLRSLSDYAWMRKSEPAQPRLLLDAAYFRRYWRAPGQFSTLPDARFSCRMSTVCCRNDFEINLVPEAQLVIDAVPWAAIEPRLDGIKLPLRADGTLRLKDANEACRFLGARRQCLMHQAVGRQPFETCAIFPYAFAHTPGGGIAVALSPVCPSARQGLGVAPLEAEDDLRDRLAQAEPRKTDHYRLRPDRAIAWENFRDIEQALLACLSADELPMRRRLYLGTRVLGAVLNNEPINTAEWLAETPAVITPELRASVRGMLEKIIRWDRDALRALPPTLPEGLADLEVRDTPVVVRILQNMLFSKSYSYPFDLTTAFNFAIILYLLTLVMQAASPGPLADSQWQELGALGVHGLLKNVLHEGVPEGFRAVLGSSEFGQWMLSA